MRKKSILEVTLLHLEKQDPAAIGFTRKQIFDALIPATEGLKGYNPYIFRTEFGSLIATALKNKIRKFLGYRQTEEGCFYFLIKEPKLEIPTGYLPYISAAGNGPYEFTHLFKTQNGQKVFMCKNKIQKRLYNQTGDKGLCPYCVQAAEFADLKSKYALLLVGYEKIVKENNELQVRNNELESKILKQPINADQHKSYYGI